MQNNIVTTKKSPIEQQLSFAYKIRYRQSSTVKLERFNTFSSAAVKNTSKPIIPYNINFVYIY